MSAAHIAPRWSALSDSYTEVNADPVAWAVMRLEVGNALLLSMVGAHRRRAWSRAAQGYALPEAT